jgi:hypothetical protein
LEARDFALTTPEGKGILGSLSDAGVVEFAIQAGAGSSIRGTEMFDRMMDHFGADAIAIHAVWIRNAAGHPSTNIDKVNELTATGVDLGQAILQAWTVTRAMRRGFSKAKVLGTPDGTPGGYTRIDVLIEQ